MTAEPRVRLDRVSKHYGKVRALEDVTLEVADGEFIALLGPSGCGKTTLLRIIAGFETPTSGRVLLGGGDVTDVSAHRRPVNMVFQRPALLPHLDVFGNVAFGPRIAGVDRDELRRRVDEALSLVRLDGYQSRRSDELSGGQMQRVALARAIVNRPQVLLLDEPLSALDLKIRLEMEVELRRLHREIGGTFIYVTHDQREALALSDRVVVFNEGRMEQVGSPSAIYRNPTSEFVARFVGDANVLAVVVEETADGRVAVIGDLALPLAPGTAPGPAWLVVRPEVVQVGPAGSGGIRGEVQDLSFRGTGHTYRISLAGLDDPLKAEMSASAEPHPLGSTVEVGWDPAAARLIPRTE